MKKLLLLLFFAAAGSLLKAQEPLEEKLAERLEKHVSTLASDSLKGRGAGTIFSEKAARYVVQNFREMGVRPFVEDSIYNQSFELGRGGVAYHNIIGYIEGCDPVLKDEYIIFGAHYDHLGYQNLSGNRTKIYHGADDNASGTAALIEVARMLKEQEGKLKRSVVFAAFDAEEMGLHGSTHMVKLLPEGKTKFMVSMDMIGWLRQGGSLKMAGVGMLEDGKDVIGSVPVPEGLDVELKKFDRNPMGGSDHDPFAEKGVPALYATTGIKSPYHKPEDTADKIDYDGLALITEYMAAMGESLANREQLEPSGRQSGKHRSSKVDFALTGSIGSSLHRYPKGALTGKPATAWNAGLFAQYNINRFFSLRLEALYQDRTARFPTEDGQLGSSYRRFNTQAVTVPLNLLFKVPIANQVYNYINLGGYYAYNLGGTLDGVPLDFDTVARRHEYGISAGFGVNLYNYGMALTYYLALSPVMYSGPVMKNSTTYFTVYYRF